MNTTWILVSSSFVFFMLVGLSFFYSGLVREKNALNTMMMSFISAGVVSLTWAVIGYSLAYSDNNLYIGGLNYFMMEEVGLEGENIPKILDFMFQCTFAIITTAIISGAVVERMNFKAYIVFIAIWSILVYAPMTKWVWGGGLFQHLPFGSALDFAGGTVVHINAAVAALVLCLVIGKRKDFGRVAILPNNVPNVLLGAGILWFGWFGFNGGSALAGDAKAALAVTNSLLCPAASIILWMLLDNYVVKKITAVGLATAIVVGLVAITPAAGLVSPVSAILIGLITTVPCYFAIMWRSKLGLDDSLDVFSAHGLGGIVGSILTGAFCSIAWGASVNGSWQQVATQVTAILIAITFSATVTLIIAKSINFFIPLRVSPREEHRGLDVALHGEEAYSESEGAILISIEDLQKS